MHLDASTSEEYIEAMAELKRYPIIGTHTVGELTISCSMKRFTLFDEHGNHFTGGARSGEALRSKVDRAFDQWHSRKFYN
jgi:hypothetical protein